MNIIMIGNSTSQKIHRMMVRSLDSNILTQSWDPGILETFESSDPTIVL